MFKPIFLLLTALATAPVVYAQQFHFDRLSPDYLEVLPPSARVNGTPGNIRITQSTCQSLPNAALRQRIVDIAAQEWGFFGFLVLDQTTVTESESRMHRRRYRGPRLNPQESARVADSIAGYWSVTSDGDWILRRQNTVWNGPSGIAARWRDPWSAAFVSWVMCEGGIGELSQFHRSIAHHTYIDQAIEARDDDASLAAFVAYDVGEVPIEPGDLLCSARRSAYRSIAERKERIGDGIRSHCDIVMKMDEENARILAIGGNVRGAVRLKLLPAVFSQRQDRKPSVQAVGRGSRSVFAHLKLRAASTEAGALENTPTIRAISEQDHRLSWLEQRLKGGLTPNCCRETVPTSNAASQYSEKLPRPL
ncbi:MAG: DUF2272 domain-containing protein [Pseudomonadota bacterium]|nr:DUF2272 domain-containing protein [Pseudomonadota bacterium]